MLQILMQPHSSLYFISLIYFHNNVSTFLFHVINHDNDHFNLFRQADHIDTALAGYFRRENLGQGENMYKCEKCHQKVPATKQYKIERPPLVLCVQLKRFNMMGGKNGRPVTLARKLNITNHVR